MQEFDPLKHDRKSIRLKDFDYSTEGLYFISICVQDRACLFGHVENGVMILNDAGKMVENEWMKLPERFPNIELHEFVVMPNHFHGILEIIAPVVPVGATLVVAQPNAKMDGDPQTGQPQTGQPQTGQPQTRQPQTGQPQTGQPQGLPLPKTIGDMVGAFQSIVTVEYIRGVKNKGWRPFNRKLWQRNYWEHIIRNEVAFYNISNYIKNNPAKWDEDRFYK